MLLLTFVFKTYRFEAEGHGFYMILVFKFTYIILLYVWSLRLTITYFKVIINIEIIGQFKDHEILGGLSHFLC